MPKLIATWNRARGVWTTSIQNIVCGHSEPYSQTWPTSGTTRAGTAYERPTSAHRTPASGSSSPPGLPTPTASRYGSNQSSSPGSAVRPSLDMLAPRLLPTPKTTDEKTPSPGDTRRREPGLRALPMLLPTPNASLATGGSQHPEIRKAGGHSVQLIDVVEHLLPTPRATDGPKGATSYSAAVQRHVDQGQANLPEQIVTMFGGGSMDRRSGAGNTSSAA